MAFPNSPATGKGAKVYMTSSDGTRLASEAMTKQASYTYKGVAYLNLIYLLGTGKTLINRRPAVEPRVDIDAIISGLDIEGNGSNDEVRVSAGNIIVDNVVTAVAADTSISVSRPASGEAAWVAISVNKSTGAFTATKGTDTSGSAGLGGLLSTYGSGAGQKPLIPVADLLVGFLKLTNGAAPVVGADRVYDDREAQVPYEILANIGGCKINSALVACHVGALTRAVKFTGYYQDQVLTEIVSAKDWNLSPTANTVSDSTLGNNYSSTELGGWSFSYNQLATDPTAKDNALYRQGHCGVKVLYPNGSGFQGAATVTPSFAVAVGSFNSIAVSGSMTEDPVEV